MNALTPGISNRTLVAVGGLARLLVAEAAIRVPQYRTDAELSEDCRIILTNSRDPILRKAAARMQMALSVISPHTITKDTAR
jgi:hypothetical protein